MNYNNTALIGPFDAANFVDVFMRWNAWKMKYCPSRAGVCLEYEVSVIPLASENSAKVWPNSFLIVVVAEGPKEGGFSKLQSIPSILLWSGAACLNRRAELIGTRNVTTWIHQDRARIKVREKHIGRQIIGGQKPLKFPTFIGTWPYCISEALLWGWSLPLFSILFLQLSPEFTARIFNRPLILCYPRNGVTLHDCSMCAKISKFN